MSTEHRQLVFICVKKQEMTCCLDNTLLHQYSISTAKNGLGEQQGSECTPRGWHQVHSIIGCEHEKNAVFVGRKWTGEIYSTQLAQQWPDRDWILTRIIRLDGLEPGRNKHDEVDSLQRYIYIHGTPDTTPMGIPGSRGCIRMMNHDIIEFTKWLNPGARVCIE